MNDAKTDSIREDHDVAGQVITPGELWCYLCVTGAIMLVVLIGLLVLGHAGTLGHL